MAPTRATRGAVDSLPLFLSLKGRPVILLGEGAAAAAKARLLERCGARIVHDADAEARIAVVALGQADVGEAVARLKARGVLVNVVDRPDLCDFTLPAIVDRSPVLIAIGTGARSATLAKALRQWLEAVLPASLGRVAQALKAARAQIAAHYPEAGDRRALLDGLVAPGGALDPLADHAAPEQAIAAALASAGGQDSGDYAELVLTSADPDDLSLRAARLLARADAVLYGPGVPAAIVDRARADAGRVAVAAAPRPPFRGRVVYLRMANG